MTQIPEKSDSGFFQEFFPWQYPANSEDHWTNGFVFDPQRYQGGFPTEVDENDLQLPAWTIGPFTKYGQNPVLAPGPQAWDAGRFGGGVHNGSIIRKDGMFYYVYRGEQAIAPINGIDYLCKIGIAASTDGVHFEKILDRNPLFCADDLISYEDVNLLEYEGTYYLFCNRWDWERPSDPSVCGCWLATSTDLLHWQPRGLLFPGAARIHRNGVVLQNPENHPVRVNGQFIMYINDFLIAYSTDLLHWQSREIQANRADRQHWPGGEGCFALANYLPGDPDALLLFTGGHHSGHFYAIGEVRLSKADPERPLAWLPRPILAADPHIPHESGLSASDPQRRISHYRDCIFFNGLTLHAGRWWMYYGGSEYYTCLATAPQTGPAAV